MVRHLNIIMIFLCFSVFSCQSISSLKDKLLKKIENFDKNKIEGIAFDKLYILEGIYKTNRNFELIYPKLEIHTNGIYYDYLYIQSTGKISFFTRNNYIKNLEITDSFNAIFYQEKNKIIINRIQTFHQIRGFEPTYGIYKQYLKVVGGKIYIQDGENCSVYVLAE